MKQTAVEWLQEQLNPDMKTMQGNIIQDLLEQALAMEKEQIENAYNDGFDSYLNPTIPSFGTIYYEETYGK